MSEIEVTDLSRDTDRDEVLDLEPALKIELKRAYEKATAAVEAAEAARLAEEAWLARFEDSSAPDEGTSESGRENDSHSQPTEDEGGAEEGYLGLEVELEAKVRTLGQKKHAARGTLLTLALYKTLVPTQDIRMNKSEHPNGFSARGVDTKVTVPFLLLESLPRNVETHWLTQSFSFAEPWTRDRVITTNPKIAGKLLVEIVNDLEESDASHASEVAHAIVVVILEELIRERNRGQVALTRPKNLTIDETRRLLSEQFRRRYRSNGPRLPQLAIYAAYACLFESGVGRYNKWELAPLGRMKAADRKSGTVGDIVVLDGGRPIEAVETKLGVTVTRTVVLEAMEKIVKASVERYFILSTVGILDEDREYIISRCADFKRSNGCEVIVNGVLDSIGYYLRLLPSTAMFLNKYAELMEVDLDLDYEHKVAWNEICASRNLV